MHDMLELMKKRPVNAVLALSPLLGLLVALALGLFG